MNINEIIHGFKVIRVEKIDEVNGTLYQMVHEKTNAQLIYLQREDENKTFSITFKTLPSDDTGVFHILEHSVLNGSDLYPVKEPFVELLKGSMQTFLNAFTYPDKTMYPVSSRNPQDFMNLMSVYMDAVFHPSIRHNANIFRQEGWHYEIRDKKDEPTFKGVVLNEMKGAFSSVDEVMINELNRMLFPDNCYKYVSGGDPEHIPDLTYEKFLETHAKFYHPSNARVFLDGDMDIDQVLAFINDNYFSQYEKEDMSFVIDDQKEIAPQIHTIPYEIENEEDLEHKTQIACAKIVSHFENVETNLAWDILTSILTANNEAPLTKAILESGLGEDVEFDIYNGIQQPWVFLNVRNTDEDKYEQIQQVFDKTFDHLIHGGLDHDQIIAALNQVEFKYREKQEPAGLMYAMRSMNSWLYDGDPTLYLKQADLFEDLRQKCAEGYFESLLEQFYQPETFQTLIAVPSLEVGKERVAKETNRLHEAKVSWQDDMQTYIEENKVLDEWQATPDTQEQLDTLPKLKREDIKATISDISFETKEIAGVPVVVHKTDDPEIVYMNAYFSLAGIKKEDLSSVALYTSLLLQLRTQNRSLENLQGYMRANLGSLRFNVESFAKRNEPQSVTPVLAVHCSVLKKNLQIAVDLIREILLETVFEKDTILPLLKQANEAFKQNMIGAGHAIAMARASASSSADGVFKEYTDGYEMGKYLKSFEEQYDDEIDMFINDTDLYRDILISKYRLTLSINQKDCDEYLTYFIDHIGKQDGMRASVRYPLLPKDDEFITIPGGVSYGATSGNLSQVDGQYDPRLQVVSHMLTYDYLWNEVRVKGGAYGTGCLTSPVGNVNCYSYRDPSPIGAFATFENIGEYLRKVVENHEDIEQMVIGTLASSNPLLSPNAKVLLGDRYYFTNTSVEDRQNNVSTILHTQVEDLAQFVDILDTLEHKQVKHVIVGNDEMKENIEGFKVLEKL